MRAYVSHVKREYTLRLSPTTTSSVTTTARSAAGQAACQAPKTRCNARCSCERVHGQARCDAMMRAIRTVHLNRAGSVKQFVTIRESGMGPSQNLGMARWACTGGGIGEARYAYAPGRCSTVFLFGRMGRWNRDRDLQRAQLIVATRMGQIVLSTQEVERRKKPRVSGAEYGGT